MKLYVADTDPEDNEDESMHLEMSASMINQSTYSTNLTRTSFVIPETLASQESESDEEKEAKKKTNGFKSNGKQTQEDIIETTQESEATQEAVTDTMIISDTMPVEKVLEVQEVQTNDVENTQTTPIKPSPVIELIENKPKPDEKTEPKVAEIETDMEKRTNGESEKSVEVELEPKVNGVLSLEPKQVNESKPVIAAPEPFIAAPEPVVSVLEPVVSVPEQVKKIIENDESIIINDDDDDEEIVEIDSVEAKPSVKQPKIEPEDKLLKKENGEVIIESTLLDNSQSNGDKISNVSIISFETTDLNDKPTNEKVVPDEETEEESKLVAQKSTGRRGRRSKVEISTVVATPTSLSSTINEADISNVNESVEAADQSSNKRRSARGSIIPNNNLVNKTQNTKGKKTAANESIEIMKETEDKKELNQSVSSTKSSITNKENEAKPEEATESKLGRRSSLRIKNNVATSASLARDKLINKVKETAKSDTPSKRRKTLDAASLKSNKKLKEDDEDEENKKEEEEEIVKAKTTKSSKKLKTAPSTSKALIEEEEENEEIEEEPVVKPKRGNPRRKTVAVDSKDIETAKKESKTKTKSPVRSKNIDTYLYEESSDSDAETNKDDKKQKNKRKTQTAADTKQETTVKKRKSKAVEPETAATTSKTKTKSKNAESESETEKQTAVAPKPRGRKRKSNDTKGDATAENQDEAKETTTTPKLFFHSKNRNKQSETPTKSTGDSSPTKKSSTLNKPSYSSVMNQSKTNDSFLSSSLADGLSPSKKFKLLKAKSSSSENLNNTYSSSDEEESTDKNKILNKQKSIAKIETETKSIETTANVTSEPLNKNKNGSETSPEVEQTTTKGKKQTRLNNTVKIEKPTVRETARSRLSLQPTTSNTPTRQTSRSKGINVPKIMTTGIVLTEKQQKVTLNSN